MDILQRIKDIRKARGMSVYELANRSGVDKNTIYRWYSKNYTPSFDSLQLICEKGFEMHIAEFFAIDGELIYATPQIKEIIQLWTPLTEEQKKVVKQILLSYKQ